MNRTEDIHRFMINNVPSHPKDIIVITAEHFGISKSAVSQHMRKLIDNNVILATGSARSRTFTLQETKHTLEIQISPGTGEDVVWRTSIAPLLPPLQQNVAAICHYGFTEMFNNVIDHSESDLAMVSVIFSPSFIRLDVFDYGIGIFRKIKEQFNLADERHAILELSKGKLTTDPSRHSGEGIFFTSRVFDEFSIFSGDLFFAHNSLGNDWLITSREECKGTYVSMSIRTDSTRTLEGIFNLFASDFSFSKTIVAITLAKYEGEQLVSRSQAKRILNRIESFREVILDFKGIGFIGRAFADEIFRVYQNQHPEIVFQVLDANEQITGLINEAKKGLN